VSLTVSVTGADMPGEESICDGEMTTFPVYTPGVNPDGLTVTDNENGEPLDAVVPEVGVTRSQLPPTAKTENWAALPLLARLRLCAAGSAVPRL
jgi:hypothetical protein